MADPEKKKSEKERPFEERRTCLICGKPGPETICEPCKETVRAEALSEKRKIEKEAAGLARPEVSDARQKPKAKTKRPAQPRPARVVLDKEAVARLAYELYVQRGREPGHDAEDWLMAEQTLLKQRTRSAARRPATKVSRRTEDKPRK